MNDSLIVMIEIHAPKADDETVNRFTRQLLREIRGLDIEQASLLENNDILTGAKGVDSVVLGMLIVSVGPMVIKELLQFLHDWAVRRDDRTLKLKFQTSNNVILEIEVPQKSRPEEMKVWIELVEKTIEKYRKDKIG